MAVIVAMAMIVGVRAGLAGARRRRHVVGWRLDAGAPEEVLEVLLERLLGLGVGRVEAVLVDHHRLVLDPLIPGFGRDLAEDALTQRAGERRVFQSGELVAQLAAVHHSRHVLILSGGAAACGPRSIYMRRVRVDTPAAGR